MQHYWLLSGPIFTIGKRPFFRAEREAPAPDSARTSNSPHARPRRREAGLSNAQQAPDLFLPLNDAIEKIDALFVRVDYALIIRAPHDKLIAKDAFEF